MKNLKKIVLAVIAFITFSGFVNADPGGGGPGGGGAPVPCSKC